MNSQSPLDIMKIREVLPHGHPMLLIDRVLKMETHTKVEPGKNDVRVGKIIGLKNVTINEPFFRGHFPDNPVMPGALIIETLSQAAAILGLEIKGGNAKTVFLTGIDKARFRKPVVPGDQLILEVEIVRAKLSKGIIKFKAFAKVNEEVVAEAELTGAF